MYQPFYTYCANNFGVSLYRPIRTLDERICQGGGYGSFMFLQVGDESESFLAEVKKLDKVWLRPYGRRKNGTIVYRKRAGPFDSYEAHLSAIIEQYDN